MDIQTLKNNELKKHIAAITISNYISLPARKSWNVLLLNAYDNLLKNEVYEIPLSVLADVIGYNSKDFKRLQQNIMELQQTLIQWDIGGGARVKGAWVNNMCSVQIIGRVVFEDGIVFYKVDEELSQLLHNPAIYQTISFSQQRLFKTSYALALWENCLRYSKVGTTGFSSVDDWRSLLGAKAKTYKEYKFFKKFVINKAVSEVNKLSNITVELRTKKRGRKVIEIAFNVKEKENVSKSSLEKMQEIKESSQYKSLISYNIHKMKAVAFINKHGYDYIQKKIDYVKEQEKLGKIKSSLSGFLIKAIENNYLSHKEYKEDQEKREKARKAQEAEWEKQLNQARKEAIDHYLENLNEAQKERLKNEFEDSKAFQYSMMNDHYLHSVYRDMNTLNEVLNHKAIQKIIRAFIFYDCLDNIEHLKNLDTWKQHHNLN